MKKIIPVVIAIVHKEGKFLLTERNGNGPDDKQYGNVWHFPGGEVEFGEELQAALHREIKEETALSINILHQLPRIHSAIRNNWHGVLIPYLCSLNGNDTIILDHESVGYGWFMYEEITKLHTLPFVMTMLEDAIKIIL